MLQTLLNGNPLVDSRAEIVAIDAQSAMLQIQIHFYIFFTNVCFVLDRLSVDALGVGYAVQIA